MSWQQLLDIYAQARAEAEALAAQPPQACPNDGTPLEAGPDGTLHCRHDGYIWPC